MIWKIFGLIISYLERILYLAGRVVVKGRSEYYFAGKNTLMDYSTVFKCPENITMGQDVWFSTDVTIGAVGGIVFGDRVRVSHGAVIETGGLNFAGAPHYPHISKPIHIDTGVWIGTGAIVLGGVHVGSDAVVAAGAVVTKNVPKFAIVGGCPARIIGYKQGLDSK
jgi:acetyltransferase-like isoleucine patch superfamily enzyme